VAVAYDANSTSNGTTSISWTHTPVGTPAGVYVFVSHCGTNPTNGTNSNDVTRVTYGGITMDQVASQTGGGTNLKGMVAAYFLGVNVPSGAQTVVVTGGSTSKYAFCRTVTAATANTKIQNYLAKAETNYTSAGTINAGTISKSGVSCLQDTVVLNCQTAVGRSCPLTSPAYSVDGTHERDWGTALTGVYRLTAVNSTDTQTGFIASTDSSSSFYYILIGICVAEDAGLGHRQTDNARASDSLDVAQDTLGIYRDTSASFPLQNGNGSTSGALTYIEVTGITASAGSLLVVCAAAGNFDALDWVPFTAAWQAAGSGDTPTLTSAIQKSGPTQPQNTEIWTGSVTSGMTGRTLRISVPTSASGSKAFNVVVDALKNADTTIGDTSSGGAEGSSGAVSVGMTGVVSGSWTYIAAINESYALTTAESGTERIGSEYKDSTPDEVANVGVNRGSTGSFNIGWSAPTSSTWRQFCAAEIKNAPPTTGPSGYVSDGVPASDVEVCQRQRDGERHRRRNERDHRAPGR
jgi:hypothetical protein